MSDTLKWWQRGVFYQIYPRSFFDAKDQDGIGDLPGIIAKLDYLQELGIDAIWLSPHYPSPQFDCGYDIADYTAVDPTYGSLQDFQTLLEEAHQRDIRVILDLVLNHTSDQHTWFQQACSSQDNPKHDWYVWREGKDGKPPNNWYSVFGGSAWEYVPQVDQYYYHYFFKEQPDLNWRNPAVKEAMFNAARFWLDRGVDGFRLDAIGILYEHPAFPDQTARYTQAEMFRRWHSHSLSEEELEELNAEARRMFFYQADQPGVTELLQELRSLVDEYEDRVLVGETEEIAYCSDDKLHLVFNFPLMRTEQLTPAWIRLNQAERLAALATQDCRAPGAWPCNTLGNHDTPRLKTHYGDGILDEQLARLHLALMLTLKGTPYLYNGEEIGMTDYPPATLGQIRDRLGIWYYNLQVELLGATPEQALQVATQDGRDKNRTPMQWSPAPNAGFCPPGIQPWLPINPNYKEGVNVEDQMGDPGSLLNFYRKMLSFRRNTPALIAGDYLPLLEESPSVMAFVRQSEEQSCLVVLNMSATAQVIDLSGERPFQGKIPNSQVLFSTHSRSHLSDRLCCLELAPFEAYIGELTSE